MSARIDRHFVLLGRFHLPVDLFDFCRLLLLLIFVLCFGVDFIQFMDLYTVSDTVTLLLLYYFLHIAGFLYTINDLKKRTHGVVIISTTTVTRIIGPSHEWVLLPRPPMAR